MNVGRMLFYAGLLTGITALSIRYPLHIYEQMTAGNSFPGAIAHLFSFFTIVINTLVVLCYLARLPAFENKLAFFKRLTTTGTAFSAIIVVMIIYHLLLSADHNPTGISALTNILQHYIAPVIFPLWWYFENRTGRMTWSMVPRMLIIPILYLVWIYARAYFTGKYPYGFLNVAEKGIIGVMPVMVAIVILFVVLGALVVFLDRRYTAK